MSPTALDHSRLFLDGESNKSGFYRLRILVFLVFKKYSQITKFHSYRVFNRINANSPTFLEHSRLFWDGESNKSGLSRLRILVFLVYKKYSQVTKFHSYQVFSRINAKSPTFLEHSRLFLDGESNKSGLSRLRILVFLVYKKYSQVTKFHSYQVYSRINAKSPTF